MLIFTLKKMLRNKWMILCLLLGSVIFVAVLSSIPTYTNGVLQHMLLKDLENRQITTKTYPGDYRVNFYIKDMNDQNTGRFSAAIRLAERVETQFVPDIGLPALSVRKSYTLDRFFYLSKSGSAQKLTNVMGMNNFSEHVTMTDGRLPSGDTSSGILEFVISKYDYAKTDISLNVPFNLYTYAIPTGDRLYSQAVCVGIYEPIENDPYWYSRVGLDSPVFIVDYDYVVRELVETESLFVKSMTLYYCLDYTKMQFEDINSLLGAVSYQKSELFNAATFSFDMADVITKYESRRSFLELMLWILEVPVILMLIFYIFMVSRLMVNYERNEIAVLKSRGASTARIFSTYVLEGGILAVIAYFAGPPLGFLICRMLGLSNGFLEFTQRKALPFHLSLSSYNYAVLAASIFLMVMLIPALFAARDTIVNAKRKKGRISFMPLWQKLFVDVILIAVSLYALYLYQTRSDMLNLTNASGMSAPIDPILIIANTLFVLGLGLFFLRIFPLVVSLIFNIGKKLWPPSVYSTLLSVSRFREGSQFLSLFLILTIGLGIWNATAARTLNRFNEDRVFYEGGADITLQQVWPTEMVTYRARVSETEVTFERGSSGATDDEIILTRMQTKEPQFIFDELVGVEEATKVFTRKANASAGRASSEVMLMGIIPDEFGRVAWFRQGLLPTHINNYLNTMTADPSAVLLSSSMRAKGFRIGDSVKIGWADQSNTLDCIVYGFVDYWPSLNPVTSKDFVIANLNLIHRQMRMEPYAVWLNMEDGASSAALYESINERGLNIASLKDTRQKLITAKNDPLLQGMNGALTLEFIVILGITFIGFLIYWILSIRGRLLQFGILRAMGLSRLGLIATLVWEQVIISGSAIFAGVFIGNIAGWVYVPTLQMVYSAAEQVPPFTITNNASDYITMFSVLAIMLIIGLSVLIAMIRGIKVDQVLKLGED